MLSDVTLQSHISYFCQDNDGGRHCQGMISDNIRHPGGVWGDLWEGFSGLREPRESKKVLLFFFFFARRQFQSECKFSVTAVGNCRRLHILTNCHAVKVFTSFCPPLIHRPVRKHAVTDRNIYWQWIYVTYICVEVPDLWRKLCNNVVMESA